MNTGMPEANTSLCVTPLHHSAPSMNSTGCKWLTFGKADAITYARIWLRNQSRFKPHGFGDEELYMFEGKNNNLLDSFAFRVALTVAIFALWSGAGYALLSIH